MTDCKVIARYWASFLNDHPGWWYSETARSPTGEFHYLELERRLIFYAMMGQG
jgi:hypothetical protein